MGEYQIRTDLSDEDARKHIHESVDGTLMGWIRTSLSLIGFGVALAGAFDFVRTGGSGNPLDTPRFHLIFAVALSFIVLGVFGLLGAIIQCGWNLKRFEQGYLTYEKPWRLSILVAVLLLITGLVGLVAMTLP